MYNAAEVQQHYLEVTGNESRFAATPASSTTGRVKDMTEFWTNAFCVIDRADDQGEALGVF